MLLSGQNMSHCVRSQNVLNIITVASHDKPMKHIKRHEVFLRLFPSHCNHEHPV